MEITLSVCTASGTDSCSGSRLFHLESAVVLVGENSGEFQVRIGRANGSVVLHGMCLHHRNVKYYRLKAELRSSRRYMGREYELSFGTQSVLLAYRTLSYLWLQCHSRLSIRNRAYTPAMKLPQL